MHNSVEIFVSDSRKDLKANSVKLELARRNVVCPTVNSYLMTASNKSRREVLCKGLKASVAGRDTPGSQNSDPHLFGFVPGAPDCEPGYCS